MKQKEKEKEKEVLKTILTVAEAAVIIKKLQNAHQLHLATGISVPRCNKLWKGEGKLDLDDIDAICDGLECSITDILQRVPISKYEEIISNRRDKK